MGLSGRNACALLVEATSAKLQGGGSSFELGDSWVLELYSKPLSRKSKAQKPEPTPEINKVYTVNSEAMNLYKGLGFRVWESALRFVDPPVDAGCFWPCR